MVRERLPYLRRRDVGRSRRGLRHPKKDGWYIAELSALAATPTRTIHDFFARGLLAKPKFLGTKTCYGRSHLVRILAIVRMRRVEKMKYAEVRARLRNMTDDEIEAELRVRGVADPVATALEGAVEQPHQGR